MAQAAATFDTYDSRRNREEFSNAIHMITPEETPFMSLVGREKVASTHPEWSTDALATPVTNNAVVEGNEWVIGTIDPTVRVGNYTMISEKSYNVSRTYEKTLKAGPASELGRQRRKKGVELKKDMEAALLANSASVAGSSSVARVAGGLPSWLTSNDDRGSGGSEGGFNSGTGLTVAATDGTQRAFTKTILDNVIQLSYNSGGNGRAFMCSPYVKTVFSTFMSNSNVAAFRTQMTGEKQGTIYGAADVYVSDFGAIDIIPNRVMAQVGASIARNGFLVDPEFVSVGIFDDIQEHKVAKTSDSDKRVLNVEYTLLVKNEAAHGVAADLYGMTASS